MMSELRKCGNCLLPETYETIEIAKDNSSCNMCRGTQYKKENIDWDARKKQLDETIEKYRGKYDYDCLIPFSGGKDSTFTLLYLMKEYKIKPLVVRFNHGFYRSKTEENRMRTLKKMGADFIDFTPNWQIVKRVMLESFIRKTDFCWHCHTGIYSFPLRVAVNFNIPLVFWGEPLAELSAYYTYQDDEIEQEDETKFNMLRNLGMSADDMWGMINSKENPIEKRQLLPYTYPKLEDLRRVGIYSVCLGSFIPWDYRANTKLIQEELGYQGDVLEGVPAEINKEFAKIECWMQGTRDYIKYLKRGYGRITQVLNFEIRQGRMSSEEAQKIIHELEGKKPQSLEVFLEYMGMTEQEFYQIIEPQVVPPHTLNTNLPLTERSWDMDQWYREDNRKSK